MRSIFRLARFRRLAVTAIGLRHGSSKATRSPRDLHNHLSQYIVGQEKAKRVLSVAVFNHFQRIAPFLVKDAEPEPPHLSGSYSHTNTSFRPGVSPDPGKTSTQSSFRPVEARPASTINPFMENDPSRGVDEVDPTLAHTLSANSRENDWARDGYFNSRPLLPPSDLSKALRKRKTTSAEKEKSDPTIVELAGADGEVARRVRVRGPELEEMVPRPALAEAETADTETSSENGLGRRKVEIEKSNVLMIGPTGTGKTLMTRTLARILDVPFASCDATTYTSAGYVGDDVENCILRLLQAADYDVARAELGIIHIDEIDKLARRGAGDGLASWGGRDVGGEGVQQAFLRLLEGTTVTLSAKPPPATSSSSGHGSPKDFDSWDSGGPNKGSLGPKKGVREGLPGFAGGGGSAGKAETFVVDTSNILFICSGAFVGLESIVNSRVGRGSMGFGARLPTPPPDVATGEAVTNPQPLKGLATTDLSQYGLIPEFLGRLPIISTLHPLSISDLVQILSEPRNALIKQYQAIFESYGSELFFTRKGLEAVAKEGLKRGGGARGLRGVLEDVLGDAMFEVPSSSVRYCLITQDVVQNNMEALYFSRGQRYLLEQKMQEEDGPVEEEDEVEDQRIRASA